MMKTLTPLLLLFIACTACSPSQNQDIGSQDSTTVAVSDTADVPAIADEIITTPEEDTSKLEVRYSQWKELVDNGKDKLYEVNIYTNQYEASSEVTWFFNENFDPVYFTMRWSAEGNEGSTEHIMKDGHVECFYIEENSVNYKWCRSTGGIHTSINEESGEVTTIVLDEEVFPDEQEMRFQEHVEILSALLRDAELVSEEDNLMTLRMEKTVNYGAEFTESTEVKIPKKVYEALK